MLKSPDSLYHVAFLLFDMNCNGRITFGKRILWLIAKTVFYFACLVLAVHGLSLARSSSYILSVVPLYHQKLHDRFSQFFVRRK